MPRVQRGKVSATFEAREARTRGCSPLVTPKLLGSIQKIQAAALEDFLCSAGFESLRDGHSRQQQMPFAVTAFPVKMRLERSKRKYKIIFPLNMPRATRRAF